MNAIRHQARVAGGLYLLLAFIAPFGLMVVPSFIIVPGDATATAARLATSGWMLRAGIASEVIQQVVGIFLVLALYRLFRGTHENFARLMVVLSLVPVPIMFLNVLNEVAALTLVSGAPYLSVFPAAHLDSLAYLFLRLHGQGIQVASIFWGLWLFPFGTLVIRSGFIPRALGVLLLVAGVGYLASAFTGLVVPQFSPAVDRIALLLEFGELPIIFWLAIWGARQTPAPAAELVRQA